MFHPYFRIDNLMKLALLLVTLLAFANGCQAEKPTSPVTITDAWVKTTVPGGRVSAAYMQIKSTAPVKLIKVETEIAGIVEIHDMKMNDGVMEMKALDSLDIPEQTAVTLKPGGLHVMLLKLNKPINTGDKVAMTLTFAQRDNKTFIANVIADAMEKASVTKHIKP